MGKYINCNVDLESRQPIGSKEQLKCFDVVGELKNFECHFELDPSFRPKIQIPHRVPLY